MSSGEQLKQRFGDQLQQVLTPLDGMVTLELLPENLISVAKALRDEADFQFDCLIDICGIDYLHYGQSEWRTQKATASGFSRGRHDQAEQNQTPRFATVYHVLSLNRNQRLRLRVWLDDDKPQVPSVFSIWNAANWFEREAFDLFGIFFEGHPDLRRLLTDYGFVGHPFRKDFPLIGEVELRYDAEQQRCVYEPVSIQPRVGVPKVIRNDNRYQREDS